jgi:hypothetical protein
MKQISSPSGAQRKHAGGQLPLQGQLSRELAHHGLAGQRAGHYRQRRQEMAQAVPVAVPGGQCLGDAGSLSLDRWTGAL